MKAADKRRAQLAADSKKQAEDAARAADRDAARAERREPGRAERERLALKRLAEVDRIEAAAPADLVRLPLDLRKQYLAATNSTGATPA